MKSPRSGGSAHCVLGPYWAERVGRSTVGVQVSARTGEVAVRG
ncbi:hypothetical protein [Carbonactinospora thermoautotrophica]|nr:hypothetical protein [Carbonactinospora thermoautotrophica]